MARSENIKEGLKLIESAQYSKLKDMFYTLVARFRIPLHIFHSWKCQFLYMVILSLWLIAAWGLSKKKKIFMIFGPEKPQPQTCQDDSPNSRAFPLNFL